MKLPVPGHQGRVAPWIRVPAFDSVPASTWRPLTGADRQFYALEAHPKKDVLGHQSGYGHSERVGGPGGNGKGTSRNTGWGRMPSGTGTPSSGRMGWGLTTPARPGRPKMIRQFSTPTERRDWAGRLAKTPTIPPSGKGRPSTPSPGSTGTTSAFPRKPSCRPPRRTSPPRGLCCRAGPSGGAQRTPGGSGVRSG